MCESKVQAWVKPRSSAFLVSSTTRLAGGFGLQRDAEVHARSSYPLLVPPLAELGAPAVRVQLHQEDAVELDCGVPKSA